VKAQKQSASFAVSMIAPVKHKAILMFSIFKKKSQKDKLHERYQKLMAEAHRLSTSNRAASDQKTAEADAVLKELDRLEAG